MICGRVREGLEDDDMEEFLLEKCRPLDPLDSLGPLGGKKRSWRRHDPEQHWQDSASRVVSSAWVSLDGEDESQDDMLNEER